MNKPVESDSASGKEFLISAIIWFIIFMLIPIFIWLGIKDWIIVLSTCTKIGAALIILGLTLLSFGVRNLTGTPTRMGAYLYSPKEMRKLVRQVSSVVSYAKIWITFWGLIYLLPLAFGIPFLL